MRVRIMQERSQMQLPDDWHVPASLRPHRELTAEEIKRCNNDATEFLMGQSRRREAVERARRK